MSGSKMPPVRHREWWWLPGLYRDEHDYYRYDDEMDAETFTRAHRILGAMRDRRCCSTSTTVVHWR